MCRFVTGQGHKVRRLILLLSLFCNHRGASVKYIPKKENEGAYIAYCPRCHKYGRIRLINDDEIESVKWSRKLGDISNFKYVSDDERGDDFGL